MTNQLEKAKQFIYRHGDLLTRKRFAYHFEAGTKDEVLDVLASYQNDDGGFGNGLELDIMCPASSGICMEMALGYLLELAVTDGPILDQAVQWILANTMDNGDIPHPEDAVKAYPHEDWWERDSGRILSIAGMLGRIGVDHPRITARASAFFDSAYGESLGEIRVYSYPVARYLRYGDRAGRHADACRQMEDSFLTMLEKDAWHHPLFFCHNRWDSPDIPESVWQSEARRAIAALQDDGGVAIKKYARLPWWRPVWTLDMFVLLKRKGFLKGV